LELEHNPQEGVGKDLQLVAEWDWKGDVESLLVVLYVMLESCQSLEF